MAEACGGKPGLRRSALSLTKTSWPSCKPLQLADSTSLGKATVVVGLKYTF